MIITKYLVVRANGDVRVRNKAGSLSIDEVAFRFKVKIPEAWGKIRGDIDIEMPEPPEVPEVELS